MNTTATLAQSEGTGRSIPLRVWVVSVVLLLCAGLAHYMTPVQHTPQIPNLETMIPAAFGDWRIDKSIVPVLPSADVEANINQVYDATLARTFINSKGERMMLSLGYSAQQAGKAKPHWQEICYRAQGFKISGLTSVPETIAGRELEVSQFVGHLRNRTEPVTYWLTLGDRVITDRYARFGHLLRLSLSRETADGFLVRVSSIDTDTERAFKKQAAFMNELLLSMPKADAVRLAGRL